MKTKQVTSTVLMIRPCNFGYNSETALDNVYQQKDRLFSSKEISQKAQVEFDNFVTLLEKHNINVIRFEDNLMEETPDSLFPNNWISTHADGSIFLYPMFAPNRRLERRQDIITYLKKNFYVSNVFDNAVFSEKNNQFLEGTGSMVLDRENQIAYACISSRTNKKLFLKWCQTMNFQAVFFVAKDNNKAIYHTNVLMSICQDMVFICLDALVDDNDKQELISLFAKTKKEIINITKKQMNGFLGNVLELQNRNNESFLVMSSSAYNVLDDFQKLIINKKSKIIHSSLDTIQYFGGGSARCMIAELFLKPNFGSKFKSSVFS